MSSEPQEHTIDVDVGDVPFSLELWDGLGQRLFLLQIEKGRMTLYTPVGEEEKE